MLQLIEPSGWAGHVLPAGADCNWQTMLHNQGQITSRTHARVATPLTACTRPDVTLFTCLPAWLQVDYVEPWLAGNARGPSTAFCLLYRLFELKPTEEEVQATITHEDSVYIRAVREGLNLVPARRQ